MKPVPGLVLARARAEERGLLDGMMQLYLHDFSAFAGIGSPYGELGEDGRFPYAYLDSYWGEEGRVPLLMRHDGRPAGFVLVNRWFASGMEGDHAVAEFFVLRKYRRAGIGTAAIRAVLRDRPGLWEVAVAQYNAPALAFWRAALGRIGQVRGLTELSGDGQRWSGPILRFMAGRKADRG